MAEQRRGLPRIPGGEPWPPNGTLVPDSAAAHAELVEAVARSVAPTSDASPAAPIGAVEAVTPPTESVEVGAAPVRRRTGLWQAPAAAALAAEGNAAVATTPAAVSASAAAPVVAAAASTAPPASAPARRVGLGQTPAATPAVAAPDAAPAAAAPARRQGLGAPAAAPAAPAPAVAAPAAAPVSVAAAPARTAPPAARIPSVARVPAAPVKQSRFTGDQIFGTLTAIVGGGLSLVVIATAVVFLVRMFLFHSAAGTAFLQAFPGESTLPDWAPVGQPLWTEWQHWLNAFFIVLVIKTGLTVRNTQRPEAMWQRRGGKGKKISIELWTHLSLDLLWLVNGVVFWVLLFATGQWVRVVPVHWDIFPNALSAALQYVSLTWPTEDGWVNYNALQVLTYFVTIFLAAPLAAITGFRMSPLWPSKATRLSKAYPVELARAIHFPVMLYFVVFVVIHVVLVLATGALRNLNHMFWGSDDSGSWAGFWVFVLGIAAIVAAWFVVQPRLMKFVGAAFGKVGR